MKNFSRSGNLCSDFGGYKQRAKIPISNETDIFMHWVLNPIQSALLSPVTANRSTDVTGVPRRFRWLTRNQNLNFAIAFLSIARQNPQVWTSVDKNEN
ncbi:MAG: hypothetical protein RMY64_36885 [Nostoc sp. DedQUE08]|uniref:hypothetical protein n=1 Tax=Nostoc sp. DedQUE08 TaxID=3075393 RepID=UPI002AD208A9|nr:hypothetical protein [Nostoc sp. DedQUE08]MDZ8071136.1 hypothetical protein [Nostoc sp. DedQUE08]